MIIARGLAQSPAHAVSNSSSVGPVRAGTDTRQVWILTSVPTDFRWLLRERSALVLSARAKSALPTLQKALRSNQVRKSSASGLTKKPAGRRQKIEPSRSKKALTGSGGLRPLRREFRRLGSRRSAQPARLRIVKRSNRLPRCSWMS